MNMENKSSFDKNNDETLSYSEKISEETKLKQFASYALETLKEMYQSLRYPEFKFARSGVIITILLTLISTSFFIFGFQLVSFVIPANLPGILISLVISFIVIYLWFLLGIKITPLIAHYLVDNKILRLFFTRGNVHYLEFVPVEKRKIAMPNILNKYVALILAWITVSAFLLNLITPNNPANIVNPGNNTLLFLLRTVILLVLVPIIFTLIYPLGWMLMDAKLKAYDSATKLNWLVGKKVSNLTTGIITLGSLFALGANVLDQNVLERVQLMIDLLLFCIINVSLVVVLISLFYNIFFQGKFYQLIIDSLEVGFGTTSVTLVDSDGHPRAEPEPIPYPEVEPEFMIPKSEPKLKPEEVLPESESDPESNLDLEPESEENSD